MDSDEILDNVSVFFMVIGFFIIVLPIWIGKVIRFLFQ
jgi:hypothetical protein